MTRLILLVLCLFLLSCDRSISQELPEVESCVTLEPAFIIEPSEGITDTSFANITSVSVDDNGILYVLDGYKCEVYVYNEGRFILKFAEKGNGPGELNSPVSISCIQDTGVVVVDPWAGGFHLYSTRGLYLDNIINLDASPPLDFEYTQSSIIAQKSERYSQSEQQYYAMIVGIYNDQLEIESELYRRDYLYDPSNIGEAIKNVVYSVRFDSDSNGNVYIAEITPDEYEVDVFNSEGSLVHVIYQDPIKSDMTVDEIETLNFFIESQNRAYNDEECNYDLEDDILRPQIVELGTTDSGYLCVFRGTSSFPVCIDIYDLESFEYDTSFVIREFNLRHDIIDVEISNNLIYIYSNTPIQKQYICAYRLTHMDNN